MKQRLIRLTALLLCALLMAGGAAAEDFDDHLLLAYREAGTCNVLEGETDLIVVLVDLPDAKWTDEAISAQRHVVETAAAALEDEAAGFGVSLDFTIAYHISRSDTPIRLDTSVSWTSAVMMNAGLPAMLVDEGDESPYADTPVLFCLNTGGRAFAQQGGGYEYPEYVVLFEDCTPGTIRHEMFHLYGARDYYEAKAIKAAAEEYCPDSVMLTTQEGSATDSLTAYLIGWQTSLDDAAIRFLQATAHVTEEDIEQAAAAGRMTGYVATTGESSQYIGAMADGFKHGWGMMRFENGDIYIGDWDWGERTGKGTYIWSSGTIYSGDYLNGQITGKGVLTFTDGTTYAGDFVNLVRTGEGVYTWPDGTTYSGTFSNDKFHGTGTYTWPDGTVYTGDFVNDVRTGSGTLTWTDGATYVGEFLNGELHGYGTRTYANGTVKSGLWQNGKYIGE